MATTQIPVLEDAHIDNANATTNYGTNSTILLDTSAPIRRILVKIPLTDFDEWDIVTQARLYVYHQATSGTGDIEIIRITGSWVQGTVTWNTEPSTGAQDGTATNSATPGWWYIDITTAVAALVAAGADYYEGEIRFVPESGTHSFTGTASEAGGNNVPYLDVTYTDSTVPAAVDDLSAEGGLNKVDLAWTEPDDGGPPITDYDIYRSESTGTETYYDSVGSKTESYSDTSVTPGTTYYYKVIAVNGLGDSALSNEAYDAPFDFPDPPTDLAASAHTSTTVTLGWTAPVDNGGSAITNYKIYTGTESGNLTYHGAVGSATAEYQVTGLDKGTVYYFAVKTVTAVGDSASSSETSEYPSTTPDAPTDLADAGYEDGQASLSWTAPADDGGAPISAYRVYRDEVLIHTTANGSTTTYVNTGLTNGTEYSYSVTAVNRDGASVGSDTLDYTPAAVPSAVGTVSTFGARASITLAWAAPASNGMAITSYSIYRGTVSGTRALLDTTASTTYTDDDTSIVNGTTYYYSVSATNVVGEGSESAEVSDALDEPTVLRGVFERMNDAIYIENRSSVNDYAEEVYGYKHPLDGRVEIRDTNISPPNRETVVSKGRAVVNGNVTVNPGDRITLESGETRKVLDVVHKSGPNGSILYKVVYF